MRRITIVLVLLVPIVALVLHAFQKTPLPAINAIQKDRPSPEVIKKMTENIQKRFSRQNVFAIAIGEERELMNGGKVKVQDIYEKNATVFAELNFFKKSESDQGQIQVMRKGDEFVLGEESYSILDVSLKSNDSGIVTLRLLQKSQ